MLNSLDGRSPTEGRRDVFCEIFQNAEAVFHPQLAGPRSLCNQLWVCSSDGAGSLYL